ncbi:SAM hydrolase/SAM-dependent halogenase family protein [Reichenbachiella agariperforans]|uniref:S-adenosyl-l-methionine hydroxide adenosyltransferase n=1 Tax=Reichenbachiella agariperforans TaxID=156994 RepID=A0A1M6UA21_REIAG|nr:SAM-dependent chlorinase/fluorinase [Reichenbachiella agariperforans]MBU2912542.1 SAM-dependent chlorinase/fluorinase [Reichenbachiella agariperforans]SHK66009.1 hypothetical protein SAMN04488028_10729 [Reichenbachiella agariperforans]
MAIVTFLSDFGLSDHYVAAVKASVLRGLPTAVIVDISHQVEVGDMGHAAYLLSSVFRDFPVGTVHIIGVSNSNERRPRSVVVEIEGHYFIGEDSGVFSLLSEQPATRMIALGGSMGTFAAQEVFGPVAARLASGEALEEVGTEISAINKYMPTRAKATKQQIAGNIVRVDHYGNLITNIMKHDFEAIMQINKYCPYEINFRREKIGIIHDHFFDVGPGECFVVFDSSGRLQIGILQGNGSELLGLMVNDQVFLDFKI